MIEPNSEINPEQLLDQQASVDLGGATPKTDIDSDTQALADSAESPAAVSEDIQDERKKGAAKPEPSFSDIRVSSLTQPPKGAPGTFENPFGPSPFVAPKGPSATDDLPLLNNQYALSGLSEPEIDKMSNSSSLFDGDTWKAAGDWFYDNVMGYGKEAMESDRFFDEALGFQLDVNGVTKSATDVSFTDLLTDQNRGFFSKGYAVGKKHLQNTQRFLFKSAYAMGTSMIEMVEGLGSLITGDDWYIPMDIAWGNESGPRVSTIDPVTGRNVPGYARPKEVFGLSSLAGQLGSFMVGSGAVQLAARGTLSLGLKGLSLSGKGAAMATRIRAGLAASGEAIAALDSKYDKLKKAVGAINKAKAYGYDTARWTAKYIATEAPVDFLFQKGSSGRFADLGYTLGGTKVEQALLGWLNDDGSPPQYDPITGRITREDSALNRFKNVIDGMLLEPFGDIGFRVAGMAGRATKNGISHAAGSVVSRFAVDGKSAAHTWLYETVTEAGKVRKALRKALETGTEADLLEAATMAEAYQARVTSFDPNAAVPEGSSTARSGPVIPDMTPEIATSLNEKLNNGDLVLLRPNQDGTLDEGFIPQNHSFIEVRSITVSEGELGSLTDAEARKRLNLTEELRDRTDHVMWYKDGEGNVKLAVVKVQPNFNKPEDWVKAITTAIRNNSEFIHYVEQVGGRTNRVAVSIADILAKNGTVKIDAQTRNRVREILRIRGIDEVSDFDFTNFQLQFIPNFEEGSVTRSVLNREVGRENLDDVDLDTALSDGDAESSNKGDWVAMDSETSVVLRADNRNDLLAQMDKWKNSSAVSQKLLRTKGATVKVVANSDGSYTVGVAFKVNDIAEAFDFAGESKSRYLMGNGMTIDLHRPDIQAIREEYRKSFRANVFKALASANDLVGDESTISNTSINLGLFSRMRLGDAVNQIMAIADPIIGMVHLDLAQKIESGDAVDDVTGHFDALNKVITVIAEGATIIKSGKDVVAHKNSDLTNPPILHEIFHATLDVALNLKSVPEAVKKNIARAMVKNHADHVSKVITGTLKINGKPVPKEVKKIIDKYLKEESDILLQNGKLLGKVDVKDLRSIRALISESFSGKYEAITAEIGKLVDKKIISEGYARDFMFAVHGMVNPQEAAVFEAMRFGDAGVKRIIEADPAEDLSKAKVLFFKIYSKMTDAFFKTSEMAHGEYVTNSIVEAIRSAHIAINGSNFYNTTEGVRGLVDAAELSTQDVVHASRGPVRTSDVNLLSELGKALYHDRVDPEMLAIVEHLAQKNGQTAQIIIHENGHESIHVNGGVDKTTMALALQGKKMAELGILVVDKDGNPIIQGEKTAKALRDKFGDNLKVIDFNAPNPDVSFLGVSRKYPSSAKTRAQRAEYDRIQDQMYNGRSPSGSPYHSGFRISSPEEFAAALARMGNNPTVTINDAEFYKDHILILSNDKGPDGLPVAGVAIRKDGYVESLFNIQNNPKFKGMGMEAMRSVIAIVFPDVDTPEEIWKIHNSKIKPLLDSKDWKGIHGEAFNVVDSASGQLESDYIKNLKRLGFEITSTSKWNEEYATPELKAQFSEGKFKHPDYLEIKVNPSKVKSGKRVLAEMYDTLEKGLFDTYRERLRLIHEYDISSGQTRWYADAIKGTFDTMSMFGNEFNYLKEPVKGEANPAETDEQFNARMDMHGNAIRVMSYLLGVFSPNSGPEINTRNAIEGFRTMMETGRVAERLDPKRTGFRVTVKKKKQTANLHGNGPETNSRRMNRIIDAAVKDFVGKNPGKEALLSEDGRPKGAELLKIVGDYAKQFEMDFTTATEDDVIKFFTKMQVFAKEVLGVDKEVFTQNFSTKGNLAGPGAANWGGKFNPKYFILPNGERADDAGTGRYVAGTMLTDADSVHNVGTHVGSKKEFIKTVRNKNGSVNVEASVEASKREIIDVYKANGIEVVSVSIHQSDSEPTVVVKTKGKVDSALINKISAELKQEAISWVDVVKGKGSKFKGEGVGGFLFLDEHGSIVIERARALMKMGIEASFGPKVGAFTGNILGNFYLFTQDLWSGIETRYAMGRNAAIFGKDGKQTKSYDKETGTISEKIPQQLFETFGTSPTADDVVREPMFRTAQDLSNDLVGTNLQAEPAMMQAILWNATQTMVDRFGQNVDFSPNFLDAAIKFLVANSEGMIREGKLDRAKFDAWFQEAQGQGRAMVDAPTGINKGSQTKVKWDAKGNRVVEEGEKLTASMPSVLNFQGEPLKGRKGIPNTWNRTLKPFSKNVLLSRSPAFDPESRKAVQDYMDGIRNPKESESQPAVNLHVNDLNTAHQAIESSILNGSKEYTESENLSKRVPESVAKNTARADESLFNHVEAMAAESGKTPTELMIDILKTHNDIDPRGIFIDGKFEKIRSVTDIDKLPPSVQVEIQRRIGMVMLTRKKALESSSRRLANLIDSIEVTGKNIVRDYESLSDEDRVKIVRLVNEVMYHRFAFRGMSSEAGRTLASLRSGVLRDMAFDGADDYNTAYPEMSDQAVSNANAQEGAQSIAGTGAEGAGTGTGTGTGAEGAGTGTGAEAGAPKGKPKKGAKGKGKKDILQLAPDEIATPEGKRRKARELSTAASVIDQAINAIDTAAKANDQNGGTGTVELPETAAPAPEAGTPTPEAGTPTPEMGAPEPTTGARKPKPKTAAPKAGTPTPETGTPTPEGEVPQKPRVSRKVYELSANVQKLIDDLKYANDTVGLFGEELDATLKELEASQMRVLELEEELGTAEELLTEGAKDTKKALSKAEAAKKREEEAKALAKKIESERRRAQGQLDKADEVREQALEKLRAERQQVIDKLKTELASRRSEIQLLKDKLDRRDQKITDLNKQLQEEMDAHAELQKVLGVGGFGGSTGGAGNQSQNLATIMNMAAHIRQVAQAGGSISNPLIFHPLNMAFASWYSTNLLSNPMTSAKNSMSAAGNILMRIAMGMAGGAVSGNGRMVSYHFRQLATAFATIGESFTIAKDSFKKNVRYVTADGATPNKMLGVGGIFSEAFPPGTLRGDVANWMKTWFDPIHQVFNRVNNFSDEFFTQFAQRAHIKANFFERAVANGSTNPAADANAMYTKMMSSHFRMTDQRIMAEARQDAINVEGAAMIAKGFGADTPEYDQAVSVATARNFRLKVQENVAIYNGRPAKDNDELLRMWGELTSNLRVAERLGSEGTFTQDPLDREGIWSRFMNWINRLKRGDPNSSAFEKTIGFGAAVIFPFLHIPGNIIGAGVSMAASPFQAVAYKMLGVGSRSTKFTGDEDWKNDFVNRFHAKDPAVRSQAYGQALTATIAYITLFMVTDSGDITGAGPTDQQERKEWLKTHRPMSIRDSSGEWHSYQFAEPFAGVVSMIVDMFTLGKKAYDKSDGEVEVFEMLARPVYTALVRGVLDKSFMTGLNDFIEASHDPDNKLPRWLGSLSSGVLPGSMAMNSINTYNDKYMREFKTFSDFWWNKYYDRNSVSARRSVTGLQIKNPLYDADISFLEALNYMLNPAQGKKASKMNVVQKALFDNGMEDTLSYSAPTSDQHESLTKLDLRKIGPKGNTVYDQLGQKMLDMGSYNSLKNLINSAQFRGYTHGYGFGNKRSEAAKSLSNEINKHRKAAWAELLKEDPDLFEMSQNWIKKDDIGKGQSREQMDETVKKLIDTYNKKKGR